MSVMTSIGPEQNLFEETPLHCRQLEVKSPVLSNDELAQVKALDDGHLRAVTLPMLFPADGGGAGLRSARDTLCARASEAVAAGYTILVLSDRGVDEDNVPIPSLLATAAVHHHLIREGTRMQVGILVESGEPREVQHFCLLLGYGAGAVNPYLAYETLRDMVADGILKDVSGDDAIKNYRKAVDKGVLKVMTKMGISTLQSYHGAQIFEAIGLESDVVDRYFTWTASRIEGVGLDVLAREAQLRHDHAYRVSPPLDGDLDVGGHYQWRRRGEHHAYNPNTVALLQHAVRAGSYRKFKEYSAVVNDESHRLCTIRGLLQFRKGDPIPIGAVEPASAIVKRFKTGAMSLGSISREAHENLAIAMNRIGGKADTRQGGRGP